MKRIAKLLARLYPVVWRERYGEEFQGLIEDRKLHVGDLFDVLWGGLKMQFASPRFVRLVLPCALVGALITTILSFRLPLLYGSETVLVMSGGAPTSDGGILPTDSESARQATGSIIAATLDDRDAMGSIIRRYNLYPRDRAKLPMDDVIREMKKSIQVLPVSSGRLDQAIHRAEQMPGRNAAAMENGRRYIRSAFILMFQYTDPRVAQKVDADLASLLFDKNRAPTSSQPVQPLYVVDGASLPSKPVGTPLSVRCSMGLLGGLLCGLLLMLTGVGRASRGAQA